MKNCKICNNEFEQKTSRGSEQLYCSDKCRQQAYIRRKAIATIGENTGNMGLSNKDNLQARFNAPGEVDRTNFANYSHNAIEQLEKTYEAKTEALKWQMKYESIAKDLEELKTKNNVLTMKLETMDDDGTDDDGGDIIGAFVKNPQPFIMGFNILIDKGFEIYERIDKKRKVAQA